MRSDFNVVIVDDLFADDDDRKVVDRYIRYLNSVIENKGFKANIKSFISPDDAFASIPKQERKRIDLYISDNNLGDGTSEGIDFYLKLKEEFICDFILYTQSVVDGIIDKLIMDLNKNKNPNLFSRFTFVSRQNDKIWQSTSQDIINHIISKREEFNNLRGLFAQSTAKIHSHLAQKILDPMEEKKYSTTIECAFKRGLFEEVYRKQLHELRLIRNALMHTDEILCSSTNRYYIEYNTPEYKRGKVFENGQKVKLYEDGNFKDLRQRLKSIENYILKI